MIYGATGYTGGLIAEWARQHALRPVLGGRDAMRLGALAERLGLEQRVAALSDPERLREALRGIRVVLHAAGPFSQTSRPMVEACLHAGAHYLDISAEVDAIEALVQRDAEARGRGIMIMPGVGFDVVPSDCLAAHVAGRLRKPRRLALGIRGLTFATRGSAKTLAEYAGRDVKVRRNGTIIGVPPGSLERSFDFGDGARASLGVGWGDVSSAYFTTGVPDVEVYFEATPVMRGMLTASRYFGGVLRTGPWQAMLQTWADLLPDGPSEEQRAMVGTVIVAEAEGPSGQRACARLRAPEAYTVASMTAPTIAARVLTGDLEVGFQTPARVYGANFVLGLPGISREDVE